MPLTATLSRSKDGFEIRWANEVLVLPTATAVAFARRILDETDAVPSDTARAALAATKANNPVTN